jgi:hypothetical protein
VLDLGLLKALSVLQYTDDHLMTSHVSMSIDVSPHLLAVFQKHRVQALIVPPGVFEDETANSALSNVHIKSIRVGGPWMTKHSSGLRGGGQAHASPPVQMPIVFHVSAAMHH